MISALYANTYIVNPNGLEDFESIVEGVNYLMNNQIDGKLIVTPGTYYGSVTWNTDISHISIQGYNKNYCFVQGSFQVYGTSNEETDYIKNLTFLNTSNPICNNDNGLYLVQNCRFTNCSGNVIINNSSLRLIENIFYSNDCTTIIHSDLQNQLPSQAYLLIKKNTFDNNTTIGPVVNVDGMGSLFIKENYFTNNEYEYNLGNWGDGSMINITASNEITTGDIHRNTFFINEDSYLCDAMLYIDNSYSSAVFSINGNSFLESISNSAIKYISNQVSLQTQYFHQIH